MVLILLPRSCSGRSFHNLQYNSLADPTHLNIQQHLTLHKFHCYDHRVKGLRNLLDFILNILCDTQPFCKLAALNGRPFLNSQDLSGGAAAHN